MTDKERIGPGKAADFDIGFAAGVAACRAQIMATANAYPRATRMLDPCDPADRAQMCPLYQIAYILDREWQRMGLIVAPSPARGVSAA